MTRETQWRQSRRRIIRQRQSENFRTFRRDPTNKLSTESTFALEREFGERAFLLVEYVGDYHVHGGPSYLINSGGGYRVTPTQQIDFHIGIGLNNNAPTYTFGIGYSFRVDGLL